MSATPRQFVEFVPGQKMHTVCTNKGEQGQSMPFRPLRAPPGLNVPLNSSLPPNFCSLLLAGRSQQEKREVGLELNVNGTGKSQLLVQGDCSQSPTNHPKGVRLMDFPGTISLRNHAYVKTNTTLTYRNIIIEILVSVSLSPTRLSLILEYDLIFSEAQEMYITPDTISQLIQLQQSNEDAGWVLSYISSMKQINGRFGGKYCYDDTYEAVTRDIQAGKFPKYLEMHYSKSLGITRIFTDITKLQAHRFVDDLVRIICQ